MKTANSIKLGAFVLLGTIFLILGLYYIGSQRNIFHLTITVSTVFKDVNGLLPGNNVRFNGINVGTVSEITAVADTSVKVTFTIEKNLTQYITKNAIASIGTDGMLGNKLVNITCAKTGPPLEEGDVLSAQNSIPMETTMRTLSATNNNLEIISENLKGVSEKLNNDHSLWNLLSDTVVAENIKSSIVNIKMVSNQSAIITGNLTNITDDIKNGKGSLGALIVDSSLYVKLKQVIVNFEKISDTTALISGNISQLTKNINDGKGSAGVFLKDTTFIHNLNKTVQSLNKSSETANEDLEALKHSFLLKKYFRKKAKEQKQ